VRVCWTDWVNLELESLVRLLSSSDIVVHGEMVIYTSVQVSPQRSLHPSGGTKVVFWGGGGGGGGGGLKDPPLPQPTFIPFLIVHKSSNF
jgi:hypothetical protein